MSEENKYHPDGEYKEYHSNGQLSLFCYYLDNVLNGEYKRWNEKGILIEHCFYVENKKHGLYIQWDNDGKLIKKVFYSEDSLCDDFEFLPPSEICQLNKKEEKVKIKKSTDRVFFLEM